MRYTFILIALLVLTQCKDTSANHNIEQSNLTDHISQTTTNDKPMTSNTVKDVRTTIIQSKDGLAITADIYEVENSDKPVILLFHQARYSRGEYIEIAPKLNELGYTCVAIDQRSGDSVNGVDNETYKAAKAAGKGTEFVDAIDDLRAAIDFALAEFYTDQVVLWGSSYSSSLVLILGNEYADQAAAILSFAPGEYFTYEEKKIEDYAAGLNTPVFFTSAKNEYNNWKAIYESIPSTSKDNYLPEDQGYHGSKALWEKSKGYKTYWEHVISFLEAHAG